MNRNVLITGGSRGIGAATARHLAGQGYHLCINYRHDRQAAEALVAQIGQDAADARRVLGA